MTSKSGVSLEKPITITFHTVAKAESEPKPAGAQTVQEKAGSPDTSAGAGQKAKEPSNDVASEQKEPVEQEAREASATDEEQAQPETVEVAEQTASQETN